MSTVVPLICHKLINVNGKNMTQNSEMFRKKNKGTPIITKTRDKNSNKGPTRVEQLLEQKPLIQLKTRFGHGLGW